MTRPAIIVPRAGPCAAGRCPRGRHARLLRHGVSGVWRELTIFIGPSSYLLTSLATTTHFGARRPRGGGMTTWWRPDLERIRAEIAAEAELEVEVKVEASDGDGANKGVKRKRAPPTKGPCEHGVKPRSQCKVCSGVSARPSALSVQGVRWGINLRARSSALYDARSAVVHKYASTVVYALIARSAVGHNMRARSSALCMQGVRWCINLRARSSALQV